MFREGFEHGGSKNRLRVQKTGGGFKKQGEGSKNRGRVQKTMRGFKKQGGCQKQVLSSSLV